MKSPCAYYLLLLYITVVIKPLIPYIEDGWVHQFNNIEHISLVHAKYGSHHLDKELANTSDNDNQKNKKAVNAESQCQFHFPASLPGLKISPEAVSLIYADLQPVGFYFIFLTSQTEPPDFS